MLPITASKKTILTVSFRRCMLFSSLFEASAVAVLSLHRFRLQCNFSVLALPLYMFVVAVLTTLPSLCYAMSSLLRGCLLRSTRRIILVGVLRMSFGGKVSPARISSHLLCLLFEIACSGGSKGGPPLTFRPN